MEFVAASKSFRTFADLQRVTRSDAVGTLALLRKQLSSLRCPLWPKFDGLLEEPEDDPSVIRIFMPVSDGGPDQQKFRKLVHVASEDKPRTLIIDCDCLMHVPQLQFRGGLASLDVFLNSRNRTYKYYASLTKLSHMWRDHGALAYEIYRAKFGNLDALKFARKVLPRCISGRWGTVTATEAPLFAAGMHKVVEVFGSLVSMRSKRASPTDGGQAALTDGGELTQARAIRLMNETSIHETTQYAIMMGRWAKEVWHALQDGLFWMCLATHFKVTGPLNHHMSFMKTKLKGMALAVHGNHLARLVRGKAMEIFLEFDQLWDADWSDVFNISEHHTTESPDQVCALIVQLITYETLSYNRRILEYVNKSLT